MGKVNDAEGRFKKKKEIKRKILLFPLVYKKNARAYFQGEINSWCKLKVKRLPKDEFGPWAITGGQSGEAARGR